MNYFLIWKCREKMHFPTYLLGFVRDLMLDSQFIFGYCSRGRGITFAAICAEIKRRVKSHKLSIQLSLPLQTI